jgi:hypothetical protein
MRDSLTRPSQSLTPELRALLACGKAALQDATQPTDRIDLPAGIDWPQFIDQAWRHDLVPLAHRFLSQRGDAPEDVQAQLRSEAISSLARNLRQVFGLKKAAAAFDRSGIPWLCIKGPVIASTLYLDPGLRPFSDIDVVIRLSDFERAYAALIADGFQPDYEMAPEWQRLRFQEQSQAALYGEGNIDLHWELLPSRYSFAQAMSGVWERAERVRVLDVLAETPSPNDTLVFLCLHAAKHEWERLIWLLDIAMLIAQSDRLDWEAFVEDLEHAGRKIPMLVSLMLVETLFGVRLPRRISSRLQVEPIAARVCNERIRLWQEESVPAKSPWPWKSLYYGSMNLSVDRRRWWFDALFRPTPLEWQAVRLPISCWRAYYAVRPIRLAWKYCFRQ